MDRIIKFRGKPTENNTSYFKDWVYGFLVISNNKYYILLDILDNIKRDNYEVYMIEVIPETVGQFIGLYDKNGKEIYEKDIILTQPLRDRPFSQKAKSKKLKGIVKYNIGYGKNFIKEPDKIKYWSAKWNVEIINKKDYEKYNNAAWGLFFECEVIGNIYDNKELINSNILE